MFNFLRLSVALLCASLVIGGGVDVDAQQPSITSALERGISSYRPEEYSEALTTLRVAVKEEPQNAEAWHHLGWALVKTGNKAEARDVFQRAIELGSPAASKRAKAAYVAYGIGEYDEAIRNINPMDDGSETGFILGPAHIGRQRRGYMVALTDAEARLQRDPKSASAHLQRAQAILALSTTEMMVMPFFGRAYHNEPKPPPNDDKAAEARRAATMEKYAQAAAGFEAYLRSPSKSEHEEFALQQLNSLRAYSQSISDAANPIFVATQITTKARVLRRPEPGYTTKARKNGISGAVSLRVVLAADGTVKHPLVLIRLPDGLTEKAVVAASKIKFEPALKDGRAVSQYVIINYQFHIY